MSMNDYIEELDSLYMDFETSVNDESIVSFPKSHQKHVDRLGEIIENMREEMKNLSQEAKEDKE